MAFETIRGESGVDFIGTDGVDILLSLNESGEKTVTANGGNDNITLEDNTGVVGNATVRAGDGDDTINIGGAQEGTTRISSSSVNGGAGNDTVNTDGALQSTLRGNEGEDTFNIFGNYTASVVNGNSGGDVFNLTGNITLEDSKIVAGNDNDGQINLDSFNITAVNSTINGNAGNDSLIIGGNGAAGVGAGNDTLTSSGFTVYGGQGDDTIFNNFSNVSGTVVYSGDKGNDSIVGGVGNGDIIGGEGIDTLAGGAGDDTISGGDGADNISGGDDDDLITGDAGDDTLGGDAGSDTITGGAGADLYNTDAGADTYVFGSISDSAAGFTGTTADTLTADFDSFTAFAAADLVDFTGAANQLAGSVAEMVNNTAVTLTADDITSGADFKTAIEATGLTASATGTIEGYVVTMNDADGDAADALDGKFYVYLNDTNTIFTSGDMMFEVPSVAAGNRFIAAMNDFLS